MEQPVARDVWKKNLLRRFHLEKTRKTGIYVVCHPPQSGVDHNFDEFFENNNFIVIYLSGCSAVGSALALGAKARFAGCILKKRGNTRKTEKTRVFASCDFLRKRFDHNFDQFCENNNFIVVYLSGCSAVGSALALGARCRRFESCHSDQKSSILHGDLLCKVLDFLLFFADFEKTAKL